MPWDEWLYTIYPQYVFAPFAERHRRFWAWIESIVPDVYISPYVALWARGGAKSSSAELAVVRLGAKQTAHYVWYCCETQDQADKHVDTIGALLENEMLARHHPTLSERALGKYGSSKGWRHNRLRTTSGLTVDAIGLDTAVRGAKVEQNRPDFIILDDIDNKTDTIVKVRKKITVLTTNVLPAGAPGARVLFIQNLIHSGSVASRLVSGTAEFLHDRIVDGPYPAVANLKYEIRDGKYVITGGEPTWEGQNIATCQAQINLWGITAFLHEAQHEIDETPGGIWNHIQFVNCLRNEVPEITNGIVFIDPAVEQNDEGSCYGVQADGLGKDGRLYRFYSWEDRTSPDDAIERGILKAVELGFPTVGVETNQGGATWASIYDKICTRLEHEGKLKHRPAYTAAKASTSKLERNQQMLVDYENGKVVHVMGTHHILERALRRFPNKPNDLADTAYWSWYHLTGGGGWAMGMAA